MTIARPVAAFVSAVTAGVTESIFSPPNEPVAAGLGPCPVDDCCTGETCTSEEHSAHHSTFEKLRSSLSYAFIELWGDLAVWFGFGLLLSGIIEVLVPTEFITGYLGGGLFSMLVMLAAGIPIYICASASTPIAAALILKGVSPGAALVFLLVGPATNMASLSILTGLLGKRSMLRYLAVLALSSVFFGLLTDQVYNWSGITAGAIVGQAAEVMPYWLQLTATTLLIIMSIKPFYMTMAKLFRTASKDQGCDCSDGSCHN